ncbi:hypothetical protein AVEN_62365-1 [Araneus ventricosus]|uniref:Uncharacterized protein n=1 Tax=Araneus ventricosus TaxID=182803 RepID=A0A4Y2H6C9_ARAVE|nr:hypothetical protein AVEN_62365-1 [Araneus ventricosus]
MTTAAIARVLSPNSLSTGHGPTLPGGGTHHHWWKRSEKAEGAVGFGYTEIRVRNPINTTQIAILVCSRLALQICKLSANLSRQVCKCETSLLQVNASLEVTIGRTCSKLALQTIAKTEYEHNPG